MAAAASDPMELQTWSQQSEAVPTTPAVYLEQSKRQAPYMGNTRGLTMKLKELLIYIFVFFHLLPGWVLGELFKSCICCPQDGLMPDMGPEKFSFAVVVKTSLSGYGSKVILQVQPSFSMRLVGAHLPCVPLI